MSNYELKNDTIATIAIQTKDAGGDVVAPPAGDTFSVASSSPSLGAALSADGNSVILTPLVQASPGISVTVSDKNGLAQAILLVDIVTDVTPTNIVLDVADATLAPQPTPPAPGP